MFQAEKWDIDITAFQEDEFGCCGRGQGMGHKMGAKKTNQAGDDGS